MSSNQTIIIGVAADSGCGKSTFMRRLTSIFGGESKALPIGRETNTLVSDLTTVICLDDYHLYDRSGRKSNPQWPMGITALHEACQDWDKMAADVTDLKAGKTVSKPIYNHITGLFDPVEEVTPTPIVIIEGLHPLVDQRVRGALDLSIYIDIADEVKFAWKAQRDIAERGATMEDVQKAVDARKPDFAAFVEPQKKEADVVIQVLMADAAPTDGTEPLLKVRFIQRHSTTLLAPVRLLEPMPDVELSCYEEDWYGHRVSVLEMVGSLETLDEQLPRIEARLRGCDTRHQGELASQLLRHRDAPGSRDGTGLMQTLCCFKIRAAYETLTRANQAKPKQQPQPQPPQQQRPEATPLVCMRQDSFLEQLATHVERQSSLDFPNSPIGVALACLIERQRSADCARNGVAKSSAHHCSSSAPAAWMQLRAAGRMIGRYRYHQVRGSRSRSPLLPMHAQPVLVH